MKPRAAWPVLVKKAQERCEQVLRDLLALYVQAHAAPLPLFANASRKYAERLRGAEAGDDAWRAARTAFGERSSDPQSGRDLPDPYVEQLYGDFDQVLALGQAAFDDAARRLFGPLLEARSST